MGKAGRQADLRLALHVCDRQRLHSRRTAQFLVPRGTRSNEILNPLPGIKAPTQHYLPICGSHLVCHLATLLSPPTLRCSGFRARVSLHDLCVLFASQANLARSPSAQPHMHSGGTHSSRQCFVLIVALPWSTVIFLWPAAVHPSTP